jgi:thioredoxin reductase (NADPH)
MAALEAEKWLAEQDVVEDGPEADKGAKKAQTNGEAPEYRQNPLL